MRLCGDCKRKPWPYAMVLFLSTFVAFVSWLTLSAAGINGYTGFWLTGLSFIAAVGVFTTYMISCLRRHCAEDDHAGH